MFVVMRNNKSGISGRYSCGAIRPHTIPMGSSLSRKSSRMTTSHAWWGMQQFLSYGVWNLLFVFMSNLTDCCSSFHDFNSAARAAGLGLTVNDPVKSSCNRQWCLERGLNALAGNSRDGFLHHCQLLIDLIITQGLLHH